jgi:hypothetical protein
MQYDLTIGEVKDFEGPFDEWEESDRPDLYAVWGESSENFYIIGDGVFYHYARRKSSDPDYDPTYPEPVWQRLTPPVEPTKYSPYTPRISDVWFWNTNCVVLLIHDPTGRHYTMKWDGSAWREEREIPSSSLIRSIWGLGPDDIFAVGVGASVYHYDGIEWTEYNTAGLDTYNSYSAIWGTGHDNLFVVGDYNPRGRSLYRYNGESWRSMSTPVSNGLWSVWGWSEALHGVYLSGIDGELLHYVEEATSVGEGFHWLEISPQEPYWSRLEDVATYKGTHYFVGSSYREAMIIKYDGTGTPETKIYHGQILDLKAVTIRDDILYTTGWIDGNENGIGVRTLNLLTGEETYFQDFEPGSHLLSSGIAVDENGSIYVGGQTSGSIGNQPNAGLFEERQGEKNYTPAGYDAFVIKYSPEGTRQWVRVFGNPDSDMYPFTSQNGERVISMDFTPDGTLLVAGKTVTNESLSFIHESGLEAGFTLESIADGITEISKGYGFIVRFTSEGVFNGGKGWDADAYQDGFVDMEFTDDGYIYFTGSISYSGKIDNQPGNWTSNILVMKLNASLESIWTRYIDNPAHQWITDTAPSPDGGLFITGSTMGSFGGRQYSDGTDALVTQMSPDGVVIGSQMVGGADSEKGILITVGRNGTPLIWASLGSPTIEGYNAEASGVFWNTGEIPYDPYAECR